MYDNYWISVAERWNVFCGTFQHWIAKFLSYTNRFHTAKQEKMVRNMCGSYVTIRIIVNNKMWIEINAQCYDIDCRLSTQQHYHCRWTVLNSHIFFCPFFNRAERMWRLHFNALCKKERNRHTAHYIGLALLLPN